jgi:hypothetical protein
MSVDDVIRHAERSLHGTDGVSAGVVRILSKDAGKPGEEREYKTGDEALVESGQAEWVVAPIHYPGAGRRLSGQGGSEHEAVPADGVETYPPAEPTSADRRVKARLDGVVAAASEKGLGAKLAEARAESERKNAGRGGDAKLQAKLGGRGARSGPVTAQSDLPADQPVEEADGGKK